MRLVLGIIGLCWDEIFPKMGISSFAMVGDTCSSLPAYQLPHWNNQLLSDGCWASGENSICGGPSEYHSGNSMVNGRAADV